MSCCCAERRCLEVIREHLRFDDLRRKVLEVKRRYGAATLLIEDSAISKGIIQSLEESDRRLGKPSPKRVPARDLRLMLELYRDCYRDWNVKHFHEHLVRDHNWQWGYTWVKTQLHAAGLVDRARRRGAHRRITRRTASRALQPLCKARGARPANHAKAASLELLQPR